ncbi:MAG: hypothetical protein Q8T08_07330 [Ignavibacteria bacterium]|nr:hypothetical protein [Ignavibacteria bacterium]
MSDSPNFFGDPKVIISILAIIISGISLIWTLANQWEQNRRWDKLNEGNPEIFEIKLSNWGEFTREQAKSIQWGYDPLLFEKNEASSVFVTPNCLVMRSAQTGERIQNTNPFFTFEEGQNELKRVGFNGDAILFRLFRPRFAIENMGKTEVKDLDINIDVKLPDQDWIRAFTSNPKIRLAGAQKSTISFDLEYPLSRKLPDQITYKIHFKYLNYKNKMMEKTIGAKWSSNLNSWAYEALN